MKQAIETPLSPNWLTKALLVTLCLVLITMPVHAFVSTWGGTSIGPLWLWKSWKDLLLAALGLAVLVAAIWRPMIGRALLRDRLVRVVLGFVVLAVASVALTCRANGSNAALAGLGMDLRYFLGAALAYVLVRFGTRVHFENWKQYIVAVGIGLAALGIVQVFLLPLDFLSSFGYDKNITIAPYTLIDENPEAPRAFATLSGPNDFGAFLLLPLVVSVMIARKRPVAWFAFGVLVAGVYVSGSRSAWLGTVVALALYFVANASLKVSSLRVFRAAAAGVLVLGAVSLLALTVPAVRLQVFHSSPGDSSLVEGSTDAHWQATLAGLKRVAMSPLGCGAGCAGPASFYSSEPKISENYYVQVAEEYGWLGLGLWVWVVWLVVQRLWQDRRNSLSLALLASFAGLSFIGLWLHVWADDPLSLTWWILAGGVLGYNESRQWKKSKNTSLSKTS